MNISPRHLLNKPALLIALAAIIALVGGILAASALLRPAQLAPDTLSATYLPGGKPIAGFHLIDHNSQGFDKASLQDRWSFIFFGYTFCPDVCPTTLTIMAAVEQQLREADPALPLRSVFVSVDPERDTTARLAQYVPYFASGMLGVTGEPEDLKHFARDLGSVFRINPPAPGQTGYLVDHSSALLLINPAGQLQAVFTPPHDAKTIARDFQSIREFYQGR